MQCHFELKQGYVYSLKLFNIILHITFKKHIYFYLKLLVSKYKTVSLSMLKEHFITYLSNIPIQYLNSNFMNNF